jgi:hypothetical protein
LPVPRPVIRPGAVSRVDRRGIHGWRIYIKRRGRDFTFLVHDHQHGEDRTRSRHAAEDRYLAELRSLPPPLRTSSSDIRSTTGVVGVSFARYVAATGKVTECFRAVYPNGSGSYTKRSFSVRRFGKRVAFRLACEARRQGLAQLTTQVCADLEAEIARRTARRRKRIP